MAVSGNVIELHIDDAEARYPISIDPLVWAEVKKLMASDAEANDLFGHSVTVSGDTAIVAAISEDDGGDGAGAAYVFERDQGGTDNWGEVEKLIASDPEAGASFGFSVALSGDIAIVGAPYDVSGGGTGAAYVFSRNQGGTDNWGEVKKLESSDIELNDVFGIGVAVSGDMAIVGAHREGAGGMNAGAAYVFSRNQGGADNWGEVKKLVASDAAMGDEFGRAVAIDGDVAVAGAPYESAELGAAYIFHRDQGGSDNWGEVKKLTETGAEALDNFGWSVAVSGDHVIVGEEAGGAPDKTGEVSIFRRDLGGTDNWGEVKRLSSSSGNSFDLFGLSVAIRGDRVVVGDRIENNRGAAYSFERDLGGADNWGEAQRFVSNDLEMVDEFGFSVSTSVDVVVAGAFREDEAAPSAGAAYVFDQRKGDGDPCVAGTECASGNCVDSVCCDLPCAGGTNDCQACSIAAGGAADGVCGARTNGATCDDGLYCNGPDDTCSGGACSVHANAPCVGPDGDADCVESCDEVTDACTANDPNGSTCDDGVFCNGTETCFSGVCGNPNGDPCLVNVGDADTDCSESCDEASDSCTSQDPDGSACSDGFFCTGTETCTAGACGSSTGDPCTVNVGDADFDCSESCNEGADSCTAIDPDGSACDDGTFCNGDESCTSGVCGSPTGDPCAANVGDADSNCSESCNEGADACVAVDPNGSACTDGVYCNGTETCTSGICGGSTGDPCAGNVGDADSDCSESCDEAADACSANDTDGSACEDGAYCNGTETCTAGVCGKLLGRPMRRFRGRLGCQLQRSVQRSDRRLHDARAERHSVPRRRSVLHRGRNLPGGDMRERRGPMRPSGRG